ncbi:MAG: enoyl-ACP reductase [Alphaproteobacteria bacterium]|nr:enoyl-ACP reductase [Rickettsiales bacterium]
MTVVKNNLLEGKKGIIMGVANSRSIAYGVAEAVINSGAQIAISYQGETMLKRVKPLAEKLGCGENLIDCDVSSDTSIDNAFTRLSNIFSDGIDFVIHSIAFANKENLKGKYCSTSRSDFALAMDVSCYSLVAVANRAQSLIKNGGSIVSMSYFGAEKVIPNYNVMGVAKSALEASVRYLAVDLGEQGVRVNSLSPGPIKTLAASGISSFGNVLGFQEKNAPLKRNVSQIEVGNASVFLLSDLSSGVTGENIYVDCGYNIIGMPNTIAD